MIAWLNINKKKMKSINRFKIKGNFIFFHKHINLSLHFPSIRQINKRKLFDFRTSFIMKLPNINFNFTSIRCYNRKINFFSYFLF